MKKVNYKGFKINYRNTIYHHCTLKELVEDSDWIIFCDNPGQPTTPLVRKEDGWHNWCHMGSPKDTVINNVEIRKEVREYWCSSLWYLILSGKGQMPDWAFKMKNAITADVFAGKEIDLVRFVETYKPKQAAPKPIIKNVVKREYVRELLIVTNDKFVLTNQWDALEKYGFTLKK